MPETSPVVWVVGGHRLTFEENYKQYGSPTLVCDWEHDLLDMRTVIERLIHSKPTDYLAIRGDNQNCPLAVAVWFMLHKECNLVTTISGLVVDSEIVHMLKKSDILQAIELARDSYAKSKER